LFKKQFFPESTIKSLATNESVHEAGTNLFNNNQVTDMTLNEENRSVELTLSDTQKYRTYFSFLENGLAQKYSCNCAAFENQSGACRHVIAGMLYLNTINQKSLNALNGGQVGVADAPSGQLDGLQDDREALNKLFNAARKDIEEQTISFSKTPLEFEVVLNMYKIKDSFDYELYLRAGTDHLYVIKDILDVTNHLLERNTYTFGKQLTFSPDTHYLLPNDRKLLSFIYEMGRTQQDTLNIAQGRHSVDSNGALMVPPKRVPELLEHLVDVAGGFVRLGPPPKLLSSINQIEDPVVIYEQDDEKIPITFNVTQEEDHYLLDVSEEDKTKQVNLHNKANMVSIDSTFYLLDNSAYEQASRLIETVRNMGQDPLELTENDLISFYSLILPNLEELFEYEAEESIENNIEHLPFKPELYIDYADDQLLAKPIFQYGDTSINPLLDDNDGESAEDEKQETGLFIRDVFSEMDTLNVLSHYFGRNDVENGQYVMDALDDMSTFIYDSLEEASELMSVYLTEAAEAIIYRPDSVPELTIELNPTSNLLDIRFDIAEVPDTELSGLIGQLQNTDERFYQLESGKIIDLEEEEFQEFFETIEKLDLQPEEISEDTSVSLLRGLTLAEEDNVAFGQEFQAFVDDLQTPDNLEFNIPDSLQATLRPYQETGFKWLSMLDYYGLGGVLADDMGLGKTIQTITFVLSKIEQQGGKYLIVSPSSVVYNWEREFDKFAPSVQTMVISGSIPERESQIGEAFANDDVDVLITSYPLIQRDIEHYKDYNFHSIVLDESQNVKNDATKTTQAVRRLSANNIFALSGTPIENNLNELWSLFSIVLPGLFRSKKSFNNLTEQQIAQKIRIFVLRRMKEDVLEDLPPKTETLEFIELSDEQKQLYQTQLSLIRNDVESMIEEDEFEQNRMRVLAGMTRLRQICDDPRLVDEDYEGGSAKLDRLIEYLREAFSNKKRVVLFSQFTSMLSIIRDILDDYDVDYHYLDGSTPKRDRFDLTTRFNEGEKDLFLVSLRAGGTGLNLTGGDTVILYDSWWNPAVEDQAADRVHRFGQDKPVQVIRMIMKGTIEEGINELQEEKRELIDSVIQTDDEKKGSSLSKEDILGLLSTES